MMTAYPRGSYPLIFTQMCESFSFFGMRTLLVLFMIQKLGYTDSDAIGLYALYTTLINLGGLVGGYCGDRILGLRGAVLLGGLFILCGHLCLAFEESTFLFHLGLSAIVVGSSLFGANMKALFGQLFPDNDVRRESGYTLYYTGINVGGFSAAVICGYMAHIYGWHAGFGLAAVGMLAGLIVLFKNKTQVGNAPVGTPLHKKLICCLSGIVLLGLCLVFFQVHHIIIPILPFLGLTMVSAVLYQLRHHTSFTRILTLCGFIGLYLVFFMFEDLMGSLLMMFCENQVNRQILGLEIPSTALVAINPLTIMICGTLFAYFAKPNQTLEGMLKMCCIAFVLLGLSFGMLFLGSIFLDDLHLVPLSFVIVSFVLIALGELFIAPSLFAFCSSSMPSNLTGRAMGLLTIGRSYASLLSGMLGQFIIQHDIGIDAGLFFTIAILLFIMAGSLVFGRFNVLRVSV